MRRFTEQEDQFIRDNYLSIPSKRMGRMMGRAEGTARQRMQLLGLVVPREIVEQRIADSRIKKGNTPINKGKKWKDFMSKQGMRNSLKTTFKKGNLPHNTRHDGAVSVRRDKTGIEYIHIRVGLSNWKLLHRVIWEQHNGRIPAKHIVMFIDGNQGNCNIENLKVITMKENMLRNTVHNYPKEIANLVQLRGALNRQINKHLKSLKK